MVEEPDIMPTGHAPDAILVLAIADHARFIGLGKGGDLAETQIAHAAPFGDQHVGTLAALREGNVGHRIGIVGLVGSGGVRPEGGHEEFAAHRLGIEEAIVVKGDRPDRVQPVFAGIGPVRIAIASLPRRNSRGE